MLKFFLNHEIKKKWPHDLINIDKFLSDSDEFDVLNFKEEIEAKIQNHLLEKKEIFQLMEFLYFFERSIKNQHDFILERLISNNHEINEQYFLSINPGSTSTKVALYKGLSLINEEEVHFDSKNNQDTLNPRFDSLEKWLKQYLPPQKRLSGIGARGGFFPTISSGTYKVNSEMLKDISMPPINHPSNLSIPLAVMIAEKTDNRNMLITTTDPVGIDEMELEYKLTGISEIMITGQGTHYLNHNAVHNYLCSILNQTYSNYDTVTAHLGGGFSFVRHHNGRAVDVINAFSGIPSMNRSGNIPIEPLVRHMEDGQLPLMKVSDYIFTKGGLLSLAGTNNFKAFLKFRDHGATKEQQKKIDAIISLFIRGIARSIVNLALDEHRIDKTIITGGIARSEEFVAKIRSRLNGIVEIIRLPGSIEHQALIAGTIKGLTEPATLLDYSETKRNNRKRIEEDNRISKLTLFERHYRFKSTRPITTLEELADYTRSKVAQSKPITIGIVGGENEEAINAAKMANEEGKFTLANFLLIGDFNEINKLAWDFDVKIDNKNYSIADTDNTIAKAVELIHDGKIDIIMKGGIKTEEIMRGYLRYLKSQQKLSKERLFSHVGVFQIPGHPKLLIVTDAAVNPNPDKEQKIKILNNALKVVKVLNIEKPKVAVISAVESVNESVPSTIECRDIALHFKDRDDCIVEGPLSFDVAMNPKIAQEKKYKGLIQGDADLLLMPDINAGNVVYKSLTVSSKASLAGVVVGYDNPIVLTSRGDSALSKFSSICLAILIKDIFKL